MPGSRGFVFKAQRPRSTKRRSPSMTKISVAESDVWISSVSLLLASEGDIHHPYTGDLERWCLQMCFEHLGQICAPLQLQLPYWRSSYLTFHLLEPVVQDVYLFAFSNCGQVDRDGVSRYLNRGKDQKVVGIVVVLQIGLFRHLGI